MAFISLRDASTSHWWCTMRVLDPCRLGGLFLAAALFPGDIRAQTATRSFQELQTVLKLGQTVVITDDRGRQTTGKVIDVSPSALVVSTPGTRSFAQATVAEVRFPDGLLNGALIGAVTGAGLATWDYLIDPSEPGNGAIFAVAIGLGTAIGVGIDAVHKGGRVLYRSPQRSQLWLSPLLGNGRHGVVVAVRF